jgi:pyridinium-3,5-biscarboxylic acid mononucleotide sulfurtransferase
MLKLESFLLSLGPVAIAVSGGVDSMTLALSARRLKGRSAVSVMHAVSPAVPTDATDRVKALAISEDWHLELIDAGEFSDPNYVSNPVNRCFFCKGNLYDEVARSTDRQILSGTNCDDLGEYRPGLIAAKRHSVLHPYVEVGMAKIDVRGLARSLGFEDLAELPASPCLSSRIETSIPIEPKTLAAIHSVETFLRAALSPLTVRCRVRRAGVVIELDEDALRRSMEDLSLVDAVRDLIAPIGGSVDVSFASYRTGSAFVGAKL